MVKNNYTIVWTKGAQLHLKSAYEFISEKSPQNALKVVQDIASALDKAISNPEVYNADRYKLNNDGTYRAYEKHHYRVAYRFHKNVIRVLRVRHTSMEPRLY
jgi:plasmid stabilization system protein ParE